ncbi:MAG: PKD domain-containing protein [Thermoplasmata archaeon]
MSGNIISYAKASAATADFGYEPEDIKEGDKVTFNASKSNSDYEIETYKWVIIDSDKTYRKEGEVVEHEFNKKGSYEVILEVEDVNGNSDEIEKTVHVEDKIKKDIDPISTSLLLSLFSILIFISIMARLIVVKL